MEISLHRCIYSCVIGLLVLPSVAGAAEDIFTHQFTTCMDKSGGVTLSMLNCKAAETKTQDGRLNGAYGKLMKELKPDRKNQLIEVQRAWIKYQDLNCKFYADPNGGTNAAVAASDCFLSTTANRAKELENLAE